MEKCKRLRNWFAVAALSSALLLTACGSEDTSSEGPTTNENKAEPEIEVEVAWEPTDHIEYIAPANPGGGWDTLIRQTSRVIAEENLAPKNFAAVNIPGSGGAVAWAQIAADSTNNHKLFAASPPVILVPLTGASQYNHEDFTPVARLITDYSVVLVRNDSPYETINDLFEDIQTNGSAVSIGGGSAAGSMDHISIVGAASEAGVNAKDVNYIAFSGGGEAMTNLLGGHVDAVSTGVGEATAQIEAGELRALAVSSPETLANLAEIPTYIESGIDYTFDIWRGIMGPKDMSPEAVAYYEELYVNMMETDLWQEVRDQLGWLDAYQNSEEFGVFLNEQYEQFESILEDLGLLEN
ncbi:tripartite tricarboxylate transporter substrate binding protein [Halalkalibacter alkalisediminis]|uniref:Tripartite tricarboxylate transporter substrate binding protein n=1 Tax=Halalkalibacter alkalisediminis TaxID=935616 RepID=A0ABV6NL51_9BACI|nr:tripartite tricarboxylate transporter substrate-binding protein [Halalkalibacter alkalisediminis]